MGQGEGENTLHSIKEAIERGAKFVEFDVWMARCKPVLSHDKPTSFANLTFLKDVLGFICLKRDVAPVIEIKDINAVADTLLWVRAYSLHNRTIVASFDLDILWEVQRIIQDAGLKIPIGYLYASFKVASDARSVGATWIMPHYSLVDEDFVTRTHNAGLKVCAWTVDDPAEVERLEKIGVDAIVTNNPELFTDNAHLAPEI